MFLDFRNGFDACVDGVCCIYEKERRCTCLVESQCHGTYTPQNLPVSVPDVVTWAVFISKSCSSAGADGDVCPSWQMAPVSVWMAITWAVAGVFHSILFIVFVTFIHRPLQFREHHTCFVSRLQPAMGSVCVCFFGFWMIGCSCVYISMAI